MTQATRRPQGAARYEIVVRGVVGETVRAALLPARAATTEPEAVLRACLVPDDLAELVADLRERGFRVTSIAAID